MTTLSRVVPGSDPCTRHHQGLTPILAVALVLFAASARAQSLVPVGARQLVIPFENASHELRLYWISEASAVVLTDDLVALGAQALSRDDRLRAFEQLRVPSVATLSDATIIRIGQVVGARQVVVGAFDLDVLRAGDQLCGATAPARGDEGVAAAVDHERG